MNENKTLTQMREGQFARVIAILSTGSMRRRLLDLGLIEGTSVECVTKSPSGDPIAFSIRGATIALRSEDSGDVLISML